MNNVERFIKTETTLQKWFTTLAKLEQEYLVARTDEIANGVYDRKPFLKSRAVERQLKTTLKKIRGIENNHNRYASADDQIYMVDKVISEHPVFVQSRRILEEIVQHAELTKAGIAKAYETMKNKPFDTTYSPSQQRDMLAEQELAAARQNMQRENSIRDAIAAQEQDIMNILGQPTPSNAVDVDNMEEEPNNGQTDNN